MPAQMRATGQGRGHARRAHDSGSLNRGAGSRNEYVNEDEREDQHQAGPQANSRQGQDRRGQKRQESDILTAHCEKVREA